MAEYEDKVRRLRATIVSGASQARNVGMEALADALVGMLDDVDNLAVEDDYGVAQPVNLANPSMPVRVHAIGDIEEGVPEFLRRFPLSKVAGEDMGTYADLGKPPKDCTRRGQ